MFFGLIFFYSHAQNMGIVRGSLKDSLDKKNISLATITIFLAKDTSVITYRLSDPSGNFRVPGIPFNIQCRMIVTFAGYTAYRKDLLLTRELPVFDIGTILMTSHPQNLEEVIVFAERPPVSVRKDTIEFNASAFKTLPNALLEDLLKKLPGIDVDQAGNILVKGKRVNRLIVDGKNFFGGDPQIASRNLPANIVDKVQVMNDKEEYDRNPNIDESELGQVINIKLRRGIKEGWFGKAYAGLGTNKRNELGTIVNMFRDTMQVSILGYSNNLNKPGFGINDVQKIGGFQRGGVSGVMAMSDGGYELNGITFGGTGQGLQRSTGGGVNYNNQFGQRITINLQYFYGRINSEFATVSTQQRFFRDTTQLTQGNSISNNLNNSQRLGGTVHWKLDSFTTVTFRPSYTVKDSKNFNDGTTRTDENFRGKINQSNSQTHGTGKSGDYEHDIYIRRVFKKKGRSLSASSDLYIGSDKFESYNDGLFSIFSLGFVEDSLVNQVRTTAGKQVRNNLRINFIEPLNKRFSLTISHATDYLRENNNINFFGKNQLNGEYDQFNQLFSNNIEREGWKNTSSVTINYIKQKFRVSLGVNYLIAYYNNIFSKTSPVYQRFSFMYPSLSISKGILNLNYRANVTEPRANYLQEVIDISNRFYQQFGNPDLKPQYVHTISLTAAKFNQKSGNSYNASISSNFGDNAIIFESSLDKNGIRSTRPINVDGTYSLNSNGRYNFQYKLNQNYKLTISPQLFLNFKNSKISINKNVSYQTNLLIGPILAVAVNYLDKIELNQRYNYNYRETKYGKNNLYRDINVFTHSLESELIIRLPKQLVWESLINYRYNPQVTAGIQKSSFRWNTGVSYLFLKQDKAQVRLYVFDLLDRNLNITRSVSENYIIDVQSTTLTRYFMVSLIYNIRNFSQGKVGGKDRSMFLF